MSTSSNLVGWSGSPESERLVDLNTALIVAPRTSGHDSPHDRFGFSRGSGFPPSASALPANYLRTVEVLKRDDHVLEHCATAREVTCAYAAAVLQSRERERR